jgi:hypothetical protein
MKRPPKPKVVLQEPIRQPKTKKIKTMAYTIIVVLEQWSDTTDSGCNFRALTPLQQLADVAVLNKEAAKGLKGVVKNKMLAKQYKELISEKMRVYFADNCEPQASMFHSITTLKIGARANIKFSSVGEWVEVDADRTPGFNSEGALV